MPVYRFRITLEDQEDFVRDIEIRPTQTLQDLFQAILSCLRFKTTPESEIATCNDHWRKEIIFSNGDYAGKKLGALVDDPHKKLLLDFDTDRPWTLYLELFKIVPDESGANYPRCVKDVGVAPSEFRIQPVDPDLLEEDEDEVTHTEKPSIFKDFDQESINEDETPEGEEGEEEEEAEGDFNYGDGENYESKYGEEDY